MSSVFACDDDWWDNWRPRLLRHRNQTASKMIREGHSIRLARPEDVCALPEIERAAGLMFKSYPGDLGIPEELYEQPNSVETFASV